MDSMLYFFAILNIFAAVGGMFIPNDVDKADDDEYEDSKLNTRRYEGFEAEDIPEYEYSQVPYNFGYDIGDNFGNTQFREENKDEDGVVRGSYGYRDPSGMYRHVSYVADAGGFHAVLRTNEPGIDNRNSADVAVVAQTPLYGYPIRRQERRSSLIEEKV
ncbi:hypothetical protein JTE90_004228 [Oedothorax gibbosus]|uniref:Cuticle protein n=1 Tax=Oedothorax gibbosus TaxID=931172 RepID=A0AAV6UPP0_9ARAC|nr:hypothetical protein JTE90_004228 [Oedothorax gibbosus]